MTQIIGPTKPPLGHAPPDVPTFRIVRIDGWTPVWDGKWHKLEDVYVSYGGAWLRTSAKAMMQYYGPELNLPEQDWFEDCLMAVYTLAFPGERSTFKMRVRLAIRNVGPTSGQCELWYWDKDGEHRMSIGVLGPGEEREVELELDLNRACPGGEFEGRPAWAIDVKVHNPAKDRYSPTGVWFDAGLFTVVVSVRHASVLRVVSPQYEPGTTTGYIGPPGKVEWTVKVMNIGSGSGTGRVRMVIHAEGVDKVLESGTFTVPPKSEKTVKLSIDLCRLGLYNVGKWSVDVYIINVDYEAVDDHYRGYIHVEVDEARLVGLMQENLAGAVCFLGLPGEVHARPGEVYDWVNFSISGWTVIAQLEERYGYVMPGDIIARLVDDSGRVWAEARLTRIAKKCGGRLGYTANLRFTVPSEEGTYRVRLQLVNTRRCDQVDDEWETTFIVTNRAPVLDLVNARGNFEAEAGEEVEYWLDLRNHGEETCHAIVYLVHGGKLVEKVPVNIGPGETKRVHVRFRAPDSPGHYTYHVLVMNMTSFRLEAGSIFTLTVRVPTPPTWTPPPVHTPQPPTRTPPPVHTPTPPPPPVRKGVVKLVRDELQWPERAPVDKPVDFRIVAHVEGGEVDGRLGVEICNDVSSPGDVVLEINSREIVLTPGKCHVEASHGGRWGECTHLVVSGRARFKAGGTYTIVIKSGVEKT